MERGVGCERNNCTGTKVIKEEGGRCAGADDQLTPRQHKEVNGGADVHLPPVEDLMLEQLTAP